MLAIQSDGPTFDTRSVFIHALPPGTLQYTWPYSYSVNGAGTAPQDIALSGSGTVLGQVLLSSSVFTLQASAPTGGAQIFSETLQSTSGRGGPTLRLSPDGTLAATSQSG